VTFDEFHTWGPTLFAVLGLVTQAVIVGWMVRDHEKRVTTLEVSEAEMQRFKAKQEQRCEDCSRDVQDMKRKVYDGGQKS